MRAARAQRLDRHFRGKVAVVTGGASGIGRSTALLLARHGASVHVVDRRGDDAERVAEEVGAAGGTAFAHTVDVADAEQVLALADAVYDESGRCDVLHNNAGVALVGGVEDLELADWQQVNAVNIMGVVHGVHAFVPRMLAQGGGAHIVTTASTLGLSVSPLFVPYCMSKHAVVGMTEALDAELSSRGIRATAVCPGAINTPIIYDAQMRGDRTPETENAAGLLQRFGSSPDTVADAVLDAIVSRQLIRTVPRVQVYPSWVVRRISPRAGAALGRLMMQGITSRAGSRQPDAQSRSPGPRGYH